MPRAPFPPSVPGIGRGPFDPRIHPRPKETKPRDVPRIYRPGERIVIDPRLPDVFEIIREQRRRVMEPKPRTRPTSQRVETPQVSPPVELPVPVFREYPAPEMEPLPQREPIPPVIAPPTPIAIPPPPKTAPTPRSRPTPTVTIPPAQPFSLPRALPLFWTKRQKRRDTSPIFPAAPAAPTIARPELIAPPTFGLAQDLTPVSDPMLPFAQPLTTAQQRNRDKQCECEEEEQERKQKRPSRVVASVKAFARRMSQNSLDNLR